MKTASRFLSAFIKAEVTRVGFGPEVVTPAANSPFPFPAINIRPDLAARTSGLPSPLKSPAVNDTVPVPAVDAVAGYIGAP